MTLLLLIIFIITEVVFGAMGLSRTVQKREWTGMRFVVNAIETALYLIMLLLPGIDFSFRFKGLFLMLMIRLAIGLLIAFLNRKNSGTKKKLPIILSSVLSVMILASALIPAFVFADYKGRPTTGEFATKEAEAILIDKTRIETFEQDGSFREVPVHFYYPEGIEQTTPHTLPLVIFSHGAFGYYESNTSTYMELASHGYVVVSLDHPYHAFFTKDSSGKTVTVNPNFISTALTVGNNDDAMSEEDLFEITSKWMELREADMNFVIDTLKASEIGDSWFLGKTSKDEITNILNATDTTKIGLMGHSLGGATAVSVGRREDISAVIDLDGTMLGEQTGVVNGNPVINEEPYPTPLLSVNKEDHYLDCLKAREMGYNYANNIILDNAVTGYTTYFKGTEHMNFTDLPLFSPFLANLLGNGTVDPADCIDRVNTIVVDFMDCYLKGEGTFTVNESY
ncbi:MAG: hypothetical protein J6X36_01200 [Lachnospiraceae bacterium]|nr:hypothetical protein [Lachnospiraceae bacterium]